MAGEIYAKRISLKLQKLLLRIFLKLRHPYLKFLCLGIILSQKIRKGHLPCHGVLLFLDFIFQNRRQDGKFLSPVSTESIQCSGKDKILDGAAVNIPFRYSYYKILKVPISAMQLPFPDDLLCRRAADTLNRRETVAYCTVRNGKPDFCFIHIRSKDRDPHFPHVLNVLCCLTNVIHKGCHKRSKKLCRVIILKIRRLIRHNCVACRMGLVKRIFCEVNHLIIDMIGGCLGNSPGNASRDLLLRISIDKVLALLFHDCRFLFRHGTAYKIGSAHGIACKIPHNLHDLLLVHNTAIGWLQDRLHLRAVIAYTLRMAFPVYVLWNKVHRTRSVKGNAGNDVLKTGRLQVFHKACHATGF